MSSYGAPYLFNGVIDNLRVTNRALTAAEVLQNYNAVASELVSIAIADSQGIPVGALSLNDGWPTPNPITVKATLNCPAGGADCTAPFNLDLDFGSGPGRFYLYDATLVPDGSNCFGDYPRVQNTYSAHTLSCNMITLLAGQSAEFSWSVWIQPSEGVTLNAQTTYGGVSASAPLSAPIAAIHPIVFLPGLGAIQPPTNDQSDPLKVTGIMGDIAKYPNLYRALEKMGYEMGKTLFVFPYDWLRSTLEAAEVLRGRLADEANTAASVPWVAGYQNPSAVGL